MRMVIHGLVLITAIITWSSALAQPKVGPAPQTVGDEYLADPPGVRVDPWVQGLEAPWSLVFLPDGRALVSERPGRIRLIRDGRLESEPYAKVTISEGLAGVFDIIVRVVVGGEGGLMGLASHPDFPDSPFVYAMHTYESEQGPRNRVVRYVDRGNRGEFDRVIFDNIPGGLNHNGGRIGFGPDGMLYVTAGETFHAEFAPDLESLGGKILRLTPEGDVPGDNPFPGSPIYSFGHRNPQGLAWHPETGDLFVSEHGPSSEYGLFAHDEINVIQPGHDYGWPRAVGAPGKSPYTDPIIVWKEVTTPPSGMTFFRGDLYVATLRSEALLRIGLDGADGVWRAKRIERWFSENEHGGRYGRLRDAVAGPDGALYVLSSNKDGRGQPRGADDTIYRIVISP